MKKLLALPLIVAILSGCSKTSKDTTTSTPTAWPYKMSAYVDGKAFSTDTCEYHFPMVTDTTSIDISGWDGTSNTATQISLSISNYHGTGTYVFSNPGTSSGELFTATLRGAFSTSGSITITSTSPYLTGTFSFTFPSGTTVTNGSFTAKKQ